MPVIPASQAVVHQMHGASFTSYAAPASGSQELCAWRVDIPGRTQGVAHQVSREEVLYVLSGTMQVILNDRPAQATAGDAVLVPAGSKFRIDNRSDEPVTAWVTTNAGLTALMPDGSRLVPPWAR
ncbi:MAG TPA: cupin domain-containing protein [Streptosporangiaceae bacterium]